METIEMNAINQQQGRTASSFIGKVRMAPVPQDPIASTGRRIRHLREHLEMSRPYFADRAGMRPTSLKNYELFFRGVDFDAVRNICELFKPERRDEIIRYIALGSHIDVDKVPAVTMKDMVPGSIAEREGGIRGFTGDDLVLAKLVRAVRMEAFGLSRPRFCDIFPEILPPTTLKNYELGYRRISYDFARHLADLAVDKVAGWKAIMKASRSGKIDVTPWVKST